MYLEYNINMLQQLETDYQSYTKEINGEVFYFVKKFILFTGFDNVSPLLTGYGMNRNFEKACHIAGVTEKAIQQKIRPDLPTAKIVDFKNYSFKGRKKSG